MRAVTKKRIPVASKPNTKLALSWDYSGNSSFRHAGLSPGWTYTHQSARRQMSALTAIQMSTNRQGARDAIGLAAE
jgi:hypothetical protein